MTEPIPIDFSRSGPEPAITEDAAAIRFAEIYKGRVLYCHDQGRWFEYDGSIWRAQRTQLVFHFARELARALSVWSTSPGQFQKTRFVSGVEKFAQADPVFARTADSWNTDPWLLGTPSGTVDLKTGRHRTSMPSDQITRATGAAPAEIADCPQWIDFLWTTTGGDEALMRFLQQIAGYSLTGITTEQALFFIYGPGGNGKGVFLNVLSKVMGDYAATAAMATFEASKNSSIPADLAMLNGARMVSASETEEGKAWAEARIKQITGGDPITARFMRENFFTFNPQFKVLVIGNHKPVLKTVDDAIKRRFNIIPFIIKPTKPDRQLEEKLKEEWPGILRWMIDGCLDWQKHGLVRPDVVTDATEEYFADQDIFGQWLEECCNVHKGSGRYFETASKLFQSWSSFAKSSGEEVGTQVTLSAILKREGFIKKRNNSGNCYYGIQIKLIENPDYTGD